MLKKLFSTEEPVNGYFRKIDWSAFWTATIVAFAVYFLTLGPSVGLEDSGELATAGDHLGVPHPPGYPFWTMCSWVFCRIFGFVTYRGQPTPAFAISLLSAVFGAFAAGCSAMLITRSASDMMKSSESGNSAAGRWSDIFAFAGGVGGSLAFAFSPVEWSQSTIVEIYSLNALFLMFVLLLTYRWMRKPSNTILWITAFAFGLGLTNYQVLLLAIVPLVLIIFFRDIRLFRDFLLVVIPMGLTALLLSAGAQGRAMAGMSGDVIRKHMPVGVTADAWGFPRGSGESIARIPCEWLLATAIVLVVAAVLVGIWFRRRGKIKTAVKTAAFCGGGGVVLMLASLLFGSTAKWSPREALVRSGNPLGIADIDCAPLVEPSTYLWIAVFLAAAIVLFACAAIGSSADKSDFKECFADKTFTALCFAGLLCGVMALAIALFIPEASTYNYGFKYNGAQFVLDPTVRPIYSWSLATKATLAGSALMIALAFSTPRGLCFAIPTSIVQIAALVLYSRGAMHGLTDPHTWWFWWPVAWNFVMLALAWATLPNGRSVALAAFFAELGVSFYAYMPIVSDLRNPPMNWGYPRTYEGFKHALMRGQYEAIGVSKIFDFENGSITSLWIADSFIKQIASYFSDLRMQFTLVAATLALVPFAMWRITVKTARAGKIVLRPVFIAAVLYVVTAVLVIESEFRNDEPWHRLDKVIIASLGVLVVFGLLILVFEQIRTMLVRLFPKLERYSDRVKSPVGVKFDMDGISQQWLLGSGACFAVMSVALVALAQVKGDIQDGFIQKVKFISSHAIFAIWIGYGLAIGLSLLKELFDKLLENKPGRWLACLRTAVLVVLTVAAGFIFLIPIYENYFNDKLVFAMGAAEQNGHTFGWQFGNYQLRGAEAIMEELDADEEPLPNPEWPPEMEPSSIFFGGTDPGRFVPTYMIYSANVRPDIYLITQNALADGTYMSVERDLYGDEIWIPSSTDSAQSFNIYLDEVRDGKRQANGDIKLENGRVQVTGALGVMEINGILCEMMFRKERLRRAFYVEESYVIRWMYPYLSPHGLIMKINKDPGPIDDETVRNDMEFWDWYSRRLLCDKALRRDFPGQKAFSKLRAAIAGLYRAKGRFAESAAAYRDACHLYPASPEAGFRYMKDILLPAHKWLSALDILEYVDRVDPNNRHTGGDSPRGLKSNIKRIAEAKVYPAAPRTTEEMINTASSFCDMGVIPDAVGWFEKAERSMKGVPSDVPDLISIAISYLRMGIVSKAKAALSKAGPLINVSMDAAAKSGICAQYGTALFATVASNPSKPESAATVQEAIRVLNMHLKYHGDDVSGWLQLSLIHNVTGNSAMAEKIFDYVCRMNPSAAQMLMQNDPQVKALAKQIIERRRKQAPAAPAAEPVFGPRASFPGRMQ